MAAGGGDADSDEVAPGGVGKDIPCTGNPKAARKAKPKAKGNSKSKSNSTGKSKNSHPPPVQFTLHSHGGVVIKQACAVETTTIVAGSGTVHRLNYDNEQHRERLHRDIDRGLLSSAVLKSCPIFEDGRMPCHVELTDRLSVHCVACQRTFKMGHVGFDEDGNVTGGRNVFNNFIAMHLTGQLSGQ